MKRRTAKRLADMAWHQRWVSRDVVVMVGNPPFPYATTRYAWAWTQRGNVTKKQWSVLLPAGSPVRSSRGATCMTTRTTKEGAA